jgi:hypothetical protein
VALQAQPERKSATILWATRLSTIAYGQRRSLSSLGRQNRHAESIVEIPKHPATEFAFTSPPLRRSDYALTFYT